MLSIINLCFGLLVGFVIGWVVRDITCMESARVLPGRTGQSKMQARAPEEGEAAANTGGQSTPKQPASARTSPAGTSPSATPVQERTRSSEPGAANEAKETTERANAASLPSNATPVAAVKPAQPKKPTPAQLDDLKQISGIGPKLEKQLQELGIRSYKDIARFTKSDIERIGEALSFKGRIERDDWVKQARALHQKKYGEKP